MSRDALVVGINTYQHLPSLQSPAHDAEAVAQKLQTYSEFRVHRLPEVIQTGQPQIGQKTAVTLRELETALINLFVPKGSNIPQTALFYFSGHGIQREAGIREGYLALSDSNPERGFYGLSLFWLRRLLQESPVRQRIVLLDCCHSGELLNFLEADPGARPGTDRLFMAASREYETAYESLTSSYSVFTQALLSGLDPDRTESGIVTNHSLTDWVSHALKGEVQQPLFESSGSEMILTRRNAQLRVGRSAVSHPSADAVCPYRGLECFDEAHAEFFFGREHLTTQLLARLKCNQFVGVVGASGSGKSSLVRAGLIPRLRKLSGENWRIKLLSPGEHPLKSLAAAFIDAEGSDLERAEQLRRAEFFLRDGGTGVAQLVQASLPSEPATTRLQAQASSRLLLVIDQFEEVFTLCRGPHAEQERQHFLSCLLEALQQVGDRLSLVIVLRSDFLSKCALYGNLFQELQRHALMMLPLKYEQVKDCIQRPAQKAGLICEPNLVYTILQDIMGSPAELPLLQYTLMELWQRRQVDPQNGTAYLTLDAYQELGGIRGTLEQQATSVFLSLSPAEQKIARRIFLSLTQLGEGTEDTRRRVLKRELIGAVYSADQVERVLEKLVLAKLVVTSRDQNACNVGEMDAHTIQLCGFMPSLCREMVDVAHEALIRHWSILRSWLDEDREMLRRGRRIEQAAQEWLCVGKPNQRDYLLHDLRLRDAEDFLKVYPQELSELAQSYISASLEAIHCARREVRQLQFALPAAAAVILMLLFSQYHSAAQTQAKKDYELQIATARERAIIAQSILQNAESDPTPALLISRLATESTDEAQTSLRMVLQSLRLQLELRGHRGAVRQIVFSPDRQRFATAGADGTIRLWAMQPHTIYNTPPQLLQVLPWAQLGSPAAPMNLTRIAFSPDGRQIAAAADTASIVKVWAIDGSTHLDLPGSAPAKQIAFSPSGEWIATVHADRTLVVWQAATGQPQARLSQVNPDSPVAFSLDGKSLIVSGTDATAQIWRLVINSGGLELQKNAALAHPGQVTEVQLSADGQWIATACEDGRARVWQSATGQLRSTFPNVPAPPVAASDESAPPPAPVERLSALAQVQFSPNQQLLATVDATQHIQVWNLQSGQRQAELPDLAPSRTMPSLTFSPDSQTLLTAASADAVPHLWNAWTGQRLSELPKSSEAMTATAFSLDGTYLLTAHDQGAIRLWSTLPGGEMPGLNLPQQQIRSINFTQVQSQESSQEVNYLTALTSGRQVHRWQIRRAGSGHSNLPAARPRLPTGAVQVQIQPLRIWQQFFTLLTGAWTGQGSASPEVKPLPDQEALPPATASQLPGETEKAEQPLNQPTARTANPASGQVMEQAAMSPDGQLVASINAAGELEVHQAQNHDWLHLLYRIPQAQSSLTRLMFSANGQWLLGIGTDRQVRIWQAQSGQLVQVLQGHEAAIQQARFSPDGKRVVTASVDRSVRLWETASGRLIRTISHSEVVNSASFSPDGRQILTASQDGIARVFETNTGALKMLYRSGTNALLDAQFNPDGRSLMTLENNSTIHLWDAQTGMEQAELNAANPAGQPHPLVQVSYSLDGQYLAALTSTGQVMLWTANWEALFRLAQNRSLRQLTSDECSRYLRLSPRECPALSLAGEPER